MILRACRNRNHQKLVEEHMKSEADAIDTPQTLNSPLNIEKGGLQAWNNKKQHDDLAYLTE